MTRGKLLIFSAPSGSGKSTILHWLMDKHPELNIAFSVSATSRSPRCNNGVMEQDGVDYYFLKLEDFLSKIEAGEFLEYEEVYPGGFYGTLRKPIEEMLDKGINVAFDIDVKGGVNIKKQFGSQALSMFIQAPSVEELRRRIQERGSDTPEQIATRIGKAEYEMTFAPQFDEVIVNDELDKAEAKAYSLISAFLNK